VEPGSKVLTTGWIGSRWNMLQRLHLGMDMDQRLGNLVGPGFIAGIKLVCGEGFSASLINTHMYLYINCLNFKI